MLDDLGSSSRATIIQPLRSEPTFLSFLPGVQQVLLALANTHDDIWIALAIGCMGMMSFPTLSAIKSNNSAEHEQGAVQGALFGASAFQTKCCLLGQF